MPDHTTPAEPIPAEPTPDDQLPTDATDLAALIVELGEDRAGELLSRLTFRYGREEVGGLWDAALRVIGEQKELDQALAGYAAALSTIAKGVARATDGLDQLRALHSEYLEGTAGPDAEHFLAEIERSVRMLLLLHADATR